MFDSSVTMEVPLDSSATKKVPLDDHADELLNDHVEFGVVGLGGKN